MAVLYIVIVVAVLGSSFALLRPLFAQSPAAAADDDSVVYVEAYMSGFSTYLIDARVGEPITIRLRSMDSAAHLDGGGKHQLAIDELDVNIIAPPRGVSEATFTPTAAGEYEFYCDICCGGRANPTMVGKLVVAA